MPKVVRSILTKISNFIRDFPNGTISMCDINVLYCNAMIPLSEKWKLKNYYYYYYYIGNILYGITNEDTIELNLSPSEWTIKYTSITSCDVERSFSRHKSVLRPNRRSFNFENLKH